MFHHTTKDTHSAMFIATVFTIAKKQIQIKYPSTDRWINKKWNTYTKKFTQPARMKLQHLKDGDHY